MEFTEAEKILQSLPVSYYLKRRLNVKLGHAPTSYIDIFNDELVVAYEQLSLIKNPTEDDIRCCLYHEVSHAFLTPLSLTIDDIMNVFEDERIETICKDYYYGVDFKNFTKKFNGFNNQKPVSARDCFYQIVRYDVGEQNFINKKNAIIMQYAYLNRDSNVIDCYDYSKAVNALYEEIKQWFEQQIQKQNTSVITSDDNKQNNNNDSNDSLNTSGCSDDTSSDNKTEQDNTNTIFSQSMSNALQTALNNVQHQFDKMIDENMQNTFAQLLFVKQKMNKMNGSAINSYSGVFDVRSVVRNDYKYFVQKDRIGNVKRFSKIKLNLFIDASGSFSCSEHIVNKMLYNLRLLEKCTSDFEFDVVSMNYYIHHCDKHHRQIHCCGTNRLTDNVFKIYDTIQDKNAININIILFDGFAATGCYNSNVEKNLANFKVFNHRNCIIISDTSNKQAIDTYCPIAKSTFVNRNYASLLISNVVKNLQSSL